MPILDDLFERAAYTTDLYLLQAVLRVAQDPHTPSEARSGDPEVWAERRRAMQQSYAPPYWPEVERRTTPVAASNDRLGAWMMAKLWLADHVEPDGDQESRPRMEQREVTLRSDALAILRGQAPPPPEAPAPSLTSTYVALRLEAAAQHGDHLLALALADFLATGGTESRFWSGGHGGVSEAAGGPGQTAFERHLEALASAIPHVEGREGLRRQLQPRLVNRARTAANPVEVLALARLAHRFSRTYEERFEPDQLANRVAREAGRRLAAEAAVLLQRSLHAAVAAGNRAEALRVGQAWEAQREFSPVPDEERRLLTRLRAEKAQEEQRARAAEQLRERRERAEMLLGRVEHAAQMNNVLDALEVAAQLALPPVAPTPAPAGARPSASARGAVPTFQVVATSPDPDAQAVAARVRGLAPTASAPAVPAAAAAQASTEPALVEALTEEQRARFVALHAVLRRQQEAGRFGLLDIEDRTVPVPPAAHTGPSRFSLLEVDERDPAQPPPVVSPAAPTGPSRFSLLEVDPVPPRLLTPDAAELSRQARARAEALLLDCRGGTKSAACAELLQSYQSVLTPEERVQVERDQAEQQRPRESRATQLENDAPQGGEDPGAITLRMQMGSEPAQDVPLSEVLAANDEDPETLVALRALRPGESVRIGGGASVLTTLTRFEDTEEAQRQRRQDHQEHLAHLSAQRTARWPDLRAAILQAATAAGVDRDHAERYLTRRRRAVLPRLGLVEVTSAASDHVRLAAATARQGLTLEPGIHARAVVDAARTTMAGWLENRSRMDLDLPSLRAQVSAARTVLDDAAVGRPESLPTFRCGMPGCATYVSVVHGLCETRGGGIQVLCPVHQRWVDAVRIGAAATAAPPKMIDPLAATYRAAADAHSHLLRSGSGDSAQILEAYSRVLQAERAMALDNANIARVRNEPQHAARYDAEAQDLTARLQEIAVQRPAPARGAQAAGAASLPILRVEEAVARIRAALRQRSGRTYNVSMGSKRSTGRGWIEIRPPGSGRHNSELVSSEEASALASLLALSPAAVHDGITLPPDQDFYWEYVDRAEGKTPRVRGKSRIEDE